MNRPVETDKERIERERREHGWRERMAKHDARWNLDPGDTIRGYKITKPSFQTGDAEGRDD